MLSLLLLVVADVITLSVANNFLRAKPAVHASHGHMSEANVRKSLLEETQAALGAGATARRVNKAEAALRPMFASLPKNEYGNVVQATARYALHRYFVQQHAWYIKGLEPDGNSSSPTDVLEDHPVAHLKELFESRLKQHGFSLHDIAVFAATLEHLIHQEALDSTDEAYELNGFSQKAMLSKEQVDDVIKTHMKIYIAGDAASQYSDEQFASMYPGWTDTKVFLRDIRKNVTYADGEHSKAAEAAFPARQPTNHVFTPGLVTRVLEEVHEHYGVFQNSECTQMKNDLLKHGDYETGLVSLSSFYQAALEHGSQLYSETQEYLRELGALYEYDMDPEHPFVIVPNYLTSKTNCISTSSLHSICCINECESLLGNLENELASPEAKPKRIAELVANLPSSTVQAPRSVSQPLLSRLEEIAKGHGGTVPIHGRMFAQWMHHAYPRECPYPHETGTKNPQTPDEWMQSGRQSISASESEMRRVVDDSRLVGTTAAPALLWSSEEELLVPRKTVGSQGLLWGFSRLAMYFVAMLSAVVGLPKLLRQIQALPNACSTVGGSIHELPTTHPTLLRTSLSCRGKTAKLDKQMV